MKKLLLFVSVFVATLSLFSQQYETVAEVRAENDYSRRIESMLEPILGHNVAHVKLTLEYPSEGLIPFGMKFSPESLPGIPISKSKGVLGKDVGGEPSIPTRILAKKISIYVSEEISTSTIEKTKILLTEWLNIDVSKGDIVEILPSLRLITEEDNDSQVFTGFYIILSIFLIIQIILIAVFIRKTDVSNQLSFEK